MIEDADRRPYRPNERFDPFVEESWIVLTAARGVAQLENLLAACVVVDDCGCDPSARSDSAPPE